MGKGLSKDNKKLVLSGKGVKQIEDNSLVDPLLDEKSTVVLESVTIRKGSLQTLPIALLAAVSLSVNLQNTLTSLDLSKNKLTTLQDSLFTLGVQLMLWLLTIQ